MNLQLMSEELASQVEAICEAIINDNTRPEGYGVTLSASSVEIEGVTYQIQISLVPPGIGSVPTDVILFQKLAVMKIEKQ